MNPVNMPDPIQKRFRYGQSWPLRSACSRNRAGSYTVPDPTFGSVPVPFAHSRCGSCLHRTDPGPIWMAWAGFGQMPLV